MYHNQIPIKKSGPKDNYSGRAKRDEYPVQNNNYNANYQTGNQYQNPKVKITIYKNGYIINNGSFKDINIPQNKKFLSQIEKGIIPQELVNKGLSNANIFLDNRKNEELIINSPSAKKYKQGKTTTNKTNVNQNMYTNNYYAENQYVNDYYAENDYANDYYKNNMYPNDVYQNVNVNANQKVVYDQGNANYNYPIEYNQGQDLNNMYYTEDYGYQYDQNNMYMNDLNNYMNNLNVGEYPAQKPKKQVIPGNIPKNKVKPSPEKNKVIQPPIQNKVIPNNAIPKKEPEIPNKVVKPIVGPEPKAIPEPKKEKKNFRTFGSWIKEEKEKEEEEKMRKMQKIKNEPKEPIKEEPKEEEEKKFVPFGGEGFNIGNVNVEGLYVKKDVKHSLNELIPMCHLNIRLFNGEIVKTEFNYTQTLASIYKYVKKLSGSDNFVLVEGFPPRPLKELNKSIKELKLDNTTLTQKLAENMII